MRKPKTTAQFVAKAIEIHEDKYDYSQVEYIRSNQKVNIICKYHNKIFKQLPTVHIRGQGCRKCAILKQATRRTKNTEYFVNKANKVHNFKYDYSKVNYVNNKTKVIIICKIHDEEFPQYTSHHLAG